MEKIEPMLTGQELKDKLKSIPVYSDQIRNESQATRLMELNHLHSIYLPSDMSVEIYTKLYMAMMWSLGKKESRLAIQQRNLNSKNLRASIEEHEVSFGGLANGIDSFSILGESGVGKTSSVAKAIQLFGGENVIEMETPYCKLIPVIYIQCPFDCSIKSMLLSILQKVDLALGTNYYNMAIKSKANINTILISTAQVLLNHVGIIVIDEIQNLIHHKSGMQLISALTELVNESGISIVFVGTPEIEVFFESVNYLARRTLVLHYTKCNYDDYFWSFCNQLWEFQYVKKKQAISDDIIYWLYQHSSGILSSIIFLFLTAQEVSIISGKELIDIGALEEAYKRMNLLHIHIQPDADLKKVTPKRKKELSISSINQEEACPQIVSEDLSNKIIVKPQNKESVTNWTFESLAKQAKKNNEDIMLLLQGKIPIVEINT